MCRDCLARHHASCWAERRACASCASARALVPDEAHAVAFTPGLGARAWRAGSGPSWRQVEPPPPPLPEKGRAERHVLEAIVIAAVCGMAALGASGMVALRQACLGGPS